MAVSRRRSGRTTTACAVLAVLAGVGVTAGCGSGADVSAETPAALPTATATTTVAAATTTTPPKPAATPTVGWAFKQPRGNTRFHEFPAGAIGGYRVWTVKKRLCVGVAVYGKDGLPRDWLPEWCATPGAASVPELSAWTLREDGFDDRLLLLPRTVASGQVGWEKLEIHDLGDGIKTALIIDGPEQRMVLRDSRGRVIEDRPLTTIVRGGTWFKLLG